MLTAWMLAIFAHMFGSPRGRFGVGLLAFTTLAGMNIGSAVLSAKLSFQPPISTFVRIIIPVCELCVIVILFQKLFVLRFSRALGLLGIYILIGIAQVLLALLVIRPFITEAYRLPTSSMSPTLPIGSLILVNKLESPRRWDIVAFINSPDHFVSCKRLVGLPGDHLRFEKGNLFVNDQLPLAPVVVAGQYLLTSHMRYQDGETITLANDEIFVIGDHTVLSYDSRSTGPAKLSSVIGVADFLYWPFDHFKMLR